MSLRSPMMLLAAGAMTLAGSALALDPSCAPGGNFDLSKWSLQLPIADDNGNVKQVSSSDLEGCGGFQDYDYFFTESGDGALVMKSTGNNDCAVTTTNSKHCRTEFRESNPDSWDPNASQNRLAVSMAVNSGSDVCIGQVFQANSGYSKPFVEIYYLDDGSVQTGVEYEISGGSQNVTTFANVPQGTTFSYEIRHEGGVFGISVNGGDFYEPQTYFDTPGAYFKVGNYNQGDEDSDVHVFSIDVTHQD